MNPRRASLINAPGTDLSDLTGLTVRQTGDTTSTTTIGNLVVQDTPCIPTSIDTSSLKAVIAALAASDPSQIKARNFWGTWVGKHIKSAWQDIKKELVKVAVEDIAEWIGVGEWVELVIQGWQLVTSLDKTTVTVTSPDGNTVRVYPIHKPHKTVDQPCGGSTRKMCP